MGMWYVNHGIDRIVGIPCVLAMEDQVEFRGVGWGECGREFGSGWGKIIERVCGEIFCRRVDIKICAESFLFFYFCRVDAEESACEFCLCGDARTREEIELKYPTLKNRGWATRKTWGAILLWVHVAAASRGTESRSLVAESALSG